MTIDEKETVNIPKIWLVFVIPLIVSFFSAWITVKVASAKSEATIDMIKTQLNRIENKLDFHIDK